MVYLIPWIEDFFVGFQHPGSGRLRAPFSARESRAGKVVRSRESHGLAGAEGPSSCPFVSS